MSENKSGYSLDFNEFNKDFFKLVEKTIPGAGETGLFKGMAAMLRDADDEAPQTPKDKGDLRASKEIEVHTPGMRAEGIKTVKKAEATLFSKEISVTGGFNKDYAKKVHEAEPGTIKFQVKHANIQNPGSKFLESKMIKNRERYMKIAAKSIENTMK